MKKIILILLVLSELILLPAEGKYSLYKSNGKYGLIDNKRNVVLKAEFSEIKYNNVYLCKTRTNGNFVYDENINLLHYFPTKMEKLIMVSPIYFYYTTGYAVDTKYCVYNILNNKIYEVSNLIEGNTRNEPWIAARSCFYSKELEAQYDRYDCVYPYREKRAVILNYDRECEIINEKFETVLNGILASADYYSEGLLPIVFYKEGASFRNPESGKSCYVDVNGNIVYECDFDFNYIWRDTIKQIQVPEIIGSFNEGIAVIQKSDKSWIILDKNFQKHYLPKDCNVESHSYHNGLLLVSKTIDGQKKYGFIDKECKAVIPFDYSYAESFDGLYAIVEKEGKEGIINTEANFYPSDKLKAILR